MEIDIQRVYDPVQSERDNYRVLVDRLWPRGLIKEQPPYDSPSSPKPSPRHSRNASDREFSR